jgi:hypothetical protein
MAKNIFICIKVQTFYFLMYCTDKAIIELNYLYNLTIILGRYFFLRFVFTFLKAFFINTFVTVFFSFSLLSLKDFLNHYN